MDCLKESSIQLIAKYGYYLQRTNGRKLSDNLHMHEFYEFLYVVSGECLHERNGAEEKMFAGNLICLVPGASHRFISQKDNTDLIVLSVTERTVERFFEIYKKYNFSNSSLCIMLPIEKRRLMIELYDIASTINPEINSEYTLMLLNQMLLFCILPDIKKNTITPNFEAILKQMNKTENIAEGMPAFLRISGYSHSQLCRLTQKYLKQTPTEYINGIRMQYAYQLIVYGNEDYETICEAVGFESYSYFCKLIKKTYGCSAAKLRSGTENIRKTV